MKKRKKQKNTLSNVTIALLVVIILVAAGNLIFTYGQESQRKVENKEWIRQIRMELMKELCNEISEELDIVTVYLSPDVFRPTEYGVCEIRYTSNKENWDLVNYDNLHMLKHFLKQLSLLEKNTE